MGNDTAGLWIPNRPSPKCLFGKGGVQKAGDKRQKTGGRRQETKIYYYCPLKINPLVDDTGGVGKYKNIGELSWNKSKKIAGKIIKIKGIPSEAKS